MEKENYIVYRHVVPNGKMYVGITSQPLNHRWKGGYGYIRQPFFYNAIKKYGWDNIKHEVLLNNLTQEHASLAEEIFISYWDLTNRDKGYNLDGGGFSGYKISEDTRHKRSLSMIGKNAGCLNGMYGKHLTEEQKEKISKANTGNKMSKESRKLMSANRPKKPVCQIDKITSDVINVFASSHEASRKTGIAQSGIWRCCAGNAKTAGGYKWKYYNIELSKKGGVELGKETKW